MDLNKNAIYALDISSKGNQKKVQSQNVPEGSNPFRPKMKGADIQYVAVTSNLQLWIVTGGSDEGGGNFEQIYRRRGAYYARVCEGLLCRGRNAAAYDARHIGSRRHDYGRDYGG